MNRARTLLVATLLLPATMIGCASQQTREVYVNPALTPDTHDSIAVIAVDQTGYLRQNTGQLINAEDRIVAELGRRGYETTLQSNVLQYLEHLEFRSTGLTDDQYLNAARHASADAILIARVTDLGTWRSEKVWVPMPTFNGQRMDPQWTASATVSLRMIDAHSGATLFTATSEASQGVPDSRTIGTVVDTAAANAAQSIPARLASVTVQTGSTPAEVWVNGACAGVTPTTIRLRPTEPVSIELRAMGYVTETLFYTPRHEDTIKRSLKSAPLAAR